MLKWIADAFGVCPSLRPFSNPLLENFSSPASTLLKCLQSFMDSFPNSRCFAADCFYLRPPFCPKPGTGAGWRAEKYLNAVLMSCCHIQSSVALGQSAENGGKAADIPLSLPAPHTSFILHGNPEADFPLRCVWFLQYCLHVGTAFSAAEKEMSLLNVFLHSCPLQLLVAPCLPTAGNPPGSVPAVRTSSASWRSQEITAAACGDARLPAARQGSPTLPASGMGTADNARGGIYRSSALLSLFQVAKCSAACNHGTFIKFNEWVSPRGAVKIPYLNQYLHSYWHISWGTWNHLRCFIGWLL